MGTRYKRPLASLLAFVLVFSALFTGVDLRSITGGSSALNALEEEQVPEEGNLETTGVETSGEEPSETIPEVISFTKTASAVAGKVNIWQITLKMEYKGDIKNIVISDKLTEDIKFLNIVGRTANTNDPIVDGRTITWAPVKLYNATELETLGAELDAAAASETAAIDTAGHPGVSPLPNKSFELSFLVELDPRVTVDKLYKTNDFAKVNYEYRSHYEWEKSERTASSPEVNPVLLTVKKVYLDHKGKEIKDESLFAITITGPGYNRTVNLKGGASIVLNDIRNIGLYTVTEANANADFTPEIKIDGIVGNSFNVLFDQDITKGKDFSVEVVNRRTELKRDVTAHKEWIGGNQWHRPAIYFQLYRAIKDGKFEAVGVPTLVEQDQVTWPDLPLTDPNGNEYRYSVVEFIKVGDKFEARAPENYRAFYKRLDKSRTLTEGMDFDALAEGDELDATVMGRRPSHDPKPKYDYLTIVNCYKIPKGNVDAEKIWMGKLNDGEMRPTIYFTLFRYTGDDWANAKLVPDAAIMEPNHSTLKAMWSNIELTNNWGVPYKFLVKETDKYGKEATPMGYEQSYDKQHEKLDYLKIVNTRHVSKGDIKAHKEWIGGDRHNRPVIYFQLYRAIKDGPSEAVGVPTLVEQDHVTWPDLPLVDFNGKTYRYSVVEFIMVGDKFEARAPENYRAFYKRLDKSRTLTEGMDLDALVDGDELDATVMGRRPSHDTKPKYDYLTIVNCYKIPKDNVDAEKIWMGKLNHDEMRPTIYFTLFRYTGDDAAKAVPVPDAAIMELKHPTLKAMWSNIELTNNWGVPYKFLVKETDKVGKEATPMGYEQSYDKQHEKLDYLKIVNTRHVSKGDIKAHKEWIGGNQWHRPVIYFQLYRAIKDGKFEAVGVPTLVEQDQVTWPDLPLVDPNGKTYRYSVVEFIKVGDKFEARAPENYRAFYKRLDKSRTLTEGMDFDALVEGDELDATVMGRRPSHDTKPKYDYLTIVNCYKIPKGDIEARKEWVGGNPKYRPEIYFQLFRMIENGEPEKVGAAKRVMMDKVLWSKLELTDAMGRDYFFFVVETNKYGKPEAPKNYTASYKRLGHKSLEAGLIAELEAEELDATVMGRRPPRDPKPKYDFLTIINTYHIPKGDIEAHKEWVGGNMKHRPEIYFQLFRMIEDGEPEKVGAARRVMMDKVLWSKLELTDAMGHDYFFVVVETNKDGKPEAPKNYTASYKRLGHKSLEAGLDAELEATELDATVMGRRPPRDPKPKYDFLTIVNTYRVLKGEIEAKKIWVNGPTPRPTIYFELMRRIGDGMAEAVPHTERKELADGVTNVKWTDVALRDMEAREYSFSIREVNAAGEALDLEHYSEVVAGLEATNTYLVEKTEVEAMKSWLGGDPANRPAVHFKLMRQLGEKMAEVVPGAAIMLVPTTGALEVTWTDIDKTNILGQAYTFSIMEVDQAGNALDLADYNEAVMGLTALNTYIIPKTEVVAKKVWVDGPTSHPTIHFQLFRQLGDAPAQIVLEAPIQALPNGMTEVKWAEVDKTNMEGQAYTYSVVEVNAKGTPTVPANYSMKAEGLTITNTYVSPLRDVTASKIWIVSDNALIVEIKVQLFADGKEVEEPVLLKPGQVNIIFKSLPEFNNMGQAIAYSVDEVEVPANFKKTISKDGLTITNTFIPSTLPQTGRTENSSSGLGGLMIAGAFALLMFIRRRRLTEQ